MEVWQELRARVALPSITESYPHADDNELLDLCRKERRVELAFENHRFFDTRTWKIAEECDGGKMWGMNVETTGKGGKTKACQYVVGLKMNDCFGFQKC